MAKILIADDDERGRWMLAHILSEYELVFAKSWPELLEKLNENQFGLVITDIVMPGHKDLVKEGFSAIFAKRNQPVIFISDYSEGALKDLPENQRLVAKPFSANVMKVYVRKMLAAIDAHEGQ